MPRSVLASSTGGTTRNDAPPKKEGEPVGLVSFPRASDEHLEAANIDVSRLLTANLQDLGTFDLPAYGWLSHLYILVTASAGAGTGAVLAEDGPFNALQNISVGEPNGATYVQFNNGWEAMLAHKYGGYLPAVTADPRRSPAFSAVTAAGNFRFLLEIPIAVSRNDALGSQANQDSAGQFKVKMSLSPSATLFTTPPSTTLPTVRVQAWMEAWDQPQTQSGGVMNEVEPIANGTTSFWTSQSGITVNSGENNIELKRKGNYLRQQIYVLRVSGSRATGDTAWPTETRWARDAFVARYYNDIVWQHRMFVRTNFSGTKDTAGALDNGLRFHDYMHDGNGLLGYESRNGWQPTMPSTRLELQGNFSSGGTLQVLTNDVAIAANANVI